MYNDTLGGFHLDVGGHLGAGGLVPRPLALMRASVLAQVVLAVETCSGEPHLVTASQVQVDRMIADFHCKMAPKKEDKTIDSKLFFVNVTQDSTFLLKSLRKD